MLLSLAAIERPAFFSNFKTLSGLLPLMVLTLLLVILVVQAILKLLVLLVQRLHERNKVSATIAYTAVIRVVKHRSCLVHGITSGSDGG
jgi:uncharacterized membrane protein